MTQRLIEFALCGVSLRRKPCLWFGDVIFFTEGKYDDSVLESDFMKMYFELLKDYVQVTVEAWALIDVSELQQPLPQSESRETSPKIIRFDWKVAECNGESKISKNNQNTREYLSSVSYGSASNYVSYDYDQIKASVKAGCPVIVSNSILRSDSDYSFVVDGCLKAACEVDNYLTGEIYTLSEDYVGCSWDLEQVHDGWYMSDIFSVPHNDAYNLQLATNSKPQN